MPVLSGLRLSLTGDLLELVGTDLELTIRTRIPADGDGDGTAVVTARLFSELLQKFDAGVVTVELGDDEATIESGRFTSTLRTLAAAEFPRLPEPSEDGGVKVDAHAFGDALRQVISAASRDDARPILTGVLIAAVPEGLRFVATDSYRLGLRDLEGVSVLAEGQKVLVAAKGLAEVQRLLGSAGGAERKGGGSGEIEVVLGDRDVLFRVGTTEVTTRLIEGEFPNYQQLIPTGYPEPAHRLPRRPAGGRQPGAPGRAEPRQRAHPPGDERRRARAVGDRAGRRRGARGARGEVRGNRPHGGVQLPVPPRRHRRRGVRRGRARVDRPVEAGGDALTEYHRLPVPPDAGEDLLTPRLAALSLRDFRCYEHAELEFPDGVTLVVGANAQGKTSLLEAAAWAATGASFRGVPDAALVRAGCESAIVRAEVRRRGARRSCSRPRSAPRAATGCGSTVTRSRVPTTGASSCGSPCSRPTIFSW